MCKYCEEYVKVFEDKEVSLLEIFINKKRKSLEVHYCDRHTVFDYEDIKIKYCPMCGQKL